MPLVMDYIIKLSICVAVVYFFYQMFLRKLTFYDWNRWYLLGYTALCFIIPVINVMPQLQKKDLDKAVIMQWIPSLKYEPVIVEETFLESLSRWDWILLLILTGSIILFLVFCIKYFSFMMMKRKARLISNQKTKIYQLDENITPFSFGNSIFINTDMHSGEELEEIVRHEFVHVKQNHTMDIIWAEIFVILNWYNPFAWFLKYNIKQNLEFIADRKVLQAGLDKKEYQYLLLKVLGSSRFAFTSHFNFSSLKKRITMMNSIKTAKVHLAKFLFLLPIVAILLLAFRKEIRRNEQLKINQPDEVINLIADTIPANDGKHSEARKIVITKRSNSNVNDTIKEQYSIVRFNNNDTVKKHPLIVIDGNIVPDMHTINNINMEDVQEFRVLNEESAKAIYGNRADDGAILVTTKKGQTGNSKLKNDRTDFVTDTVIIMTDKNAKLTGSVAGIQIKENVKIDPNDPDKIVVYEDATRNPNKAIIVTGYPVRNKQNVANVLTINSKNADPIFIMDGKAISKEEMKNVNPNEIESMSILKDKSATTVYGDKGKDGVILITTKAGKVEAIDKKNKTVMIADTIIVHQKE